MNPESHDQTDLVTFERPPVNEVVLSVQFATEVVDEVGMLANFWPQVREAFPLHEKQPPLPPMTEEFGLPSGDGPQFQFLQGPMAPRYWFVSSDKTSLIQVQADRFTLNW